MPLLKPKPNQRMPTTAKIVYHTQAFQQDVQLNPLTYSLKFLRIKHFALLPNSAQKQIFTDKSFVVYEASTHALHLSWKFAGAIFLGPFYDPRKFLTSKILGYTIKLTFKPVVQMLQIQEVHLGPHSNACNFFAIFISFFSYLSHLGYLSLLAFQTKTRR